jgi:uncharacterized protein YbjT (DUF2867 family)
MNATNEPTARAMSEAWIAGATGLVGRTLLELLLDRADVQRVTAIVRRPTGHAHPKLLELIVDFARLEAELAGRSATDVFCCLGTTIAAAGSQEAFRRVDHDYPLALARAAREAGARRFVVVTAAGSNPGSSLFYSRVKGELERDLEPLGFPELAVLRPGLLLGERAERRRGERLAMALAGPMKLLFRGPLGKYRPVAASDVARAMLKVALDGPAPAAARAVYESDRIASLAATL